MIRVYRGTCIDCLKKISNKYNKRCIPCFAKSKCKPIEPRFFNKVDKTGDCWLWIGSTYICGYGRMSWNGKTQSSHRISWKLKFGEIPNNLFVLHKCDEKLCVNPDHLFLGTQRDNILDLVKKGRNAKHHSRKWKQLRKRSIIRIRKLYEEFKNYSKIANIYKVSRVTIMNVVKRKTWKHI